MASVKRGFMGALLIVLTVFFVGSIETVEAAKSKGNLKSKKSWVKELKLSKTQRLELKKITSIHNKRIQKKQNTLDSISTIFKGSISKKIPESEVRDRFKAMMDARSGLARAKLDKALAMRKILTPEQMKVFRERK